MHCVTGCGKIAAVGRRGMCISCYKKSYRSGDSPKRFTGASERFYSHVDKNGPIPPRAPHLGNCWIWTANQLPAGYGIVGRGGRSAGTELAHRFVWELEVGPIPEKATIDHLCFVPACVRRIHLEVVTQKVNNGRATGNQFQLNAAKTECKHGHPFVGNNLILRTTKAGGTMRVCRECGRIAQRESLRRKRGTVA